MEEESKPVKVLHACPSASNLSISGCMTCCITFVMLLAGQPQVVWFPAKLRLLSQLACLLPWPDALRVSKPME